MLIHKKPIGTLCYLGGTPAVLEKFCWSFAQLALHSQMVMCNPSVDYLHIDRSRVSAHAKARNELVQHMKGEWILMLDTDHEPEPDLLARMINLYKRYHLDVLVGIYQIKVYPYNPLIYQFDAKGEELNIISSIENPQHAEIMEIAAAGGGCLLINRDVIYRIATELKEMPFDIMMHSINGKPLSEDLSFFHRCRKLGIKCYAAINVENPHLDIVPITMEGTKDIKMEGMEGETKITSAGGIILKEEK
jgi:hypothetical protein